MSSLAGGTEDRKPVDRLLLNADLFDKSPACYTISRDCDKFICVLVY